MTTYLLLRDNKQSGPYTFDELKEKGLKAYDLVWVEGKSAAWRYPSEIEELIAFAPIVEEQPFDRFYKKPSQNTPTTNSVAERTSSSPVVAASVISGETSSVPGRRIIYVTLPAAKTAPAARETREVARPATHEKYLPEYSPAPVTAVTVHSFEENTAHFNEEGRSDVEITPRGRRKQRSSRVGQSVVVGLTVLALLAAGIFIGLSINKDSLGFVKDLSLNSSKHMPAQTTPSSLDHPSHALAITTPPTSAPLQDPVKARDSITATSPGEAGITNIPLPKVTNTLLKDKSLPVAQKTQTAVATSRDSSLQAMPAVHRESSHRADLSVEKVDKDVIRNNISNLVSIGASGYTVGTFGGITDLQLTVSNHSVYSLDLVVVEVQYIQSNKKVFKTENLYFRGIAPGSALMQEAPKSSRGIKVQYKITLVNSKELGLSYSAL